MDFGILTVFHRPDLSKYSIDSFHAFHKARSYIGAVRREVILRFCQIMQNGTFCTSIKLCVWKSHPGYNTVALWTEIVETM